MLQAASNWFKAVKQKLMDFVDFVDRERPRLDGAIVKKFEYIEVDHKERKVLNRQASQRVTLPKKWYNQDLKAVDLTLLRNPNDPKDVTHILVKPIFKEDEN